MSDRYQKGIEQMRKQLGPEADKYVEAIREIAPTFARVNVEFAFGDIYGDEQASIDLKTRELCTVAALTAMGNALPQLKLHIANALRVGASQQEIVDVITQMICYCGFPAATNAIMAAKDVFKNHQ